MTGLDALQSVQYVTVGKGRFAVVDLDEWESLIEWLETVEDIQLVKESVAELEANNGDRQRAGWRRWDELKDETSPNC
jgi:hypothetical protein